MRIVVLVLCAMLLSIPVFSEAQTSAELEARIKNNQIQIDALDREIEKYRSQINSLQGNKQTLEKAIKTLEATRSKLSADIRKTEIQIAKTQDELVVILGDIGTAERQLTKAQQGIAESLRSIAQTEDITPIELMVNGQSLGDAWFDVAALSDVQNSLTRFQSEVVALKSHLGGVAREQESKKDSLLSLRKQLSGQKQVVEGTKAEQAAILKETKNQEAEYQKILKQKQEAKAAFERDLLDIESLLKVSIDTSRIAPVGKGVLSWPLDSVKITQNFGNTSFATANPQVYNGKGHNGIDFGAPTGTPIKAALSGTITGTGNTDSVKGCYSYGKWVLVKHANGLSTLYAHLSTISVSAGDSVKTGEVIGLSGNTGYSTGPHLHFTVYSTQGVAIQKLGDVRQQKTGCSAASIPIAPPDAYLNPLSYL